MNNFFSFLKSKCSLCCEHYQKWHLIDYNLRYGGKPKLYNYLIQSLLAGFFFIIFIMLLDFLGYLLLKGGTPGLNSKFIAASIASSIFLVFGAPSVPTSCPRALIGGQIINIITGGIGLWCCFFAHSLDFGWTLGTILLIGIGVSMFSSLLLMTIFDAEHPPAAGTAVSMSMLYLSEEPFLSIAWLSIFIIIAAVCLGLIRHYFYVPDGLKALKGLDKNAIDILKSNGVITLEHFRNQNIDTLTDIFEEEAKYYSQSFPLWMEQSKDEKLNQDADNKWLLKDLF